MILWRSLLWMIFLSTLAAPLGARPTLNVYLAGGVVPEALIRAFETETGITVNLSTYDSNETMYAKLRAGKQGTYDIILPSSYYVERMNKYHLLTKLDKDKIPNLKNLDQAFANNSFDPNNQYHVPLIWGVTGIFYNQRWIHHPPRYWRDLWAPRWRNQLMLVDDIRDIFSMALLSLGYEANDSDPQHIDAAYQHLRRLIPNIKLFTVDAMQSLMIDEDAHIGISWNGNVTKAQAENKALRFVYPADGFLIWIESLAIPKGATHLKEAYQFINYLLKASSGVQITKIYGFSITNFKSIAQLPAELRSDPNRYPSAKIMQKGSYQRDVSEEIMEMYNDYWEHLKLAC